MKTLFSTTLLALTLSTSALAGEGSGVGNGGGLWTCRDNTPERALIWAELLDLSEAQREFHLKIDRASPLNVDGWLAYVSHSMAWATPEFAQEYQKRIKLVKASFPSALVNESEFRGTADFLHRTSPDDSTCPEGTISHDANGKAPEQLANFTNQNHLIVNQQLWSSKKLADIDRAALMVHEAIYKLFRDLEGAEDSVKTREIVGYLFSTLPTSSYAHLLKFVRKTTGSLPVSPVPGHYRDIMRARFDVAINDYNLRTNHLFATEYDKDGDTRHSHEFLCERSGSETLCKMVNTSNWRLKLRGFDKQRLRFSEENSFVWHNKQPSGTVRATRYKLLQ